MSKRNIGNRINGLLRNALVAILTQGQIAQLSYSAIDVMIKKINEEDNPEYNLSYPVGCKPDKTPMFGNRTYSKDEIISQYTELTNSQIAVNGIYQLVTILEAALSDFLREVILTYPQKIGKKRDIKSNMVLSCTSIEELHLKIVDEIVHKLSFASPKDFAEECKSFFSINMLECPAFHKYLEIKATRDIYIHNLGVANEKYIVKADSHARVKSGQRLPVNIAYFLESYEYTLQLIEWLEIRAHETWHSSEFEERRAQKESTS